MAEPASIRTKNPGAMWPGPTATKWGSTDFIALNDGTGQGNKIAIFDTWVQGICAQLDLWRTSDKYRNKQFSDAIAIWSGGNNVEDYIAYVLKRVPGMDRNTVMNDEFWKGPMGLAFLKAQAGHEAGKKYPAPDDDWAEAQRRVFEGGGLVVPAQSSAEPAWLGNARKLSGLTEIVGSRHEAKVLEFFAEAGHPEIHDDETAWCAAFANAMLRRAGYAGTGSLAARSFLTWGTTLDAPRLGCIVVYKRGDSEWQGHVNFFTRKVGSKIYGIGGNQSNAVNETGINEADVLGYRWPLITGASKPMTPAKPPAATPNKSAATAAAGAAGGAVVVGAGTAAAQSGLSAPEILAIITCVSVAAGGVILIIYRIVKGHWPWTSTGNQSLELLPLSLPSSGPSLEQVSADLLAVSSAASPVTPLPRRSASKKPRKRSARPSRKTRTQPRKSSNSKRTAARKSAPRRKPKSRS